MAGAAAASVTSSAGCGNSKGGGDREGFRATLGGVVGVSLTGEVGEISRSS